ncbi:MAG: FISUMP domain-containing protein [Bacteroidales bacterium]|jgi:uncharacterized protein (TIGR02145 family)
MIKQYLRRLILMVFTIGYLIMGQGCIKDPSKPEMGPFTDSRDQRVYQWVVIGTQTWMAENLAYLPAVSPPSAGSETEPYFYVFKFTGSDVDAAKRWGYYEDYGVFYNWPAALNGGDSSKASPSGVRGICPEGWHLPSDGEWDTLVNFLGGDFTAGWKMKSVKGWIKLDGESGDGNNSSGFNALPAGCRLKEGTFFNSGNSARFWTATACDSHTTWDRELIYTHNGANRYKFIRGYGFSVRCVKDIP